MIPAQINATIHAVVNTFRDVAHITLTTRLLFLEPLLKYR